MPGAVPPTVKRGASSTATEGRSSGRITLERADSDALLRWDEVLKDSASATVFHRLEWLLAIEEESRSELIPLIALRDDEPVAKLPLFLRRFAGARMIFSPPPGCAVPSLGLVMTDPGKTRSAAGNESDFFSIVDVVADYIGRVVRPHVCRLVMTGAVHDVRPFQWHRFAAQPRYTYTLDLSGGADAVFSRFKRQTRIDIRRASRYPDVTVEEGSEAHFFELIRNIRSRYQDQGIVWNPSDRYLQRLFAEFGGSELRVKVLLKDGRLVAGLVLLVERNVVRHWLGGLRPLESLTGANELLHWTVAEEFASIGFDEYELMGANTRHLTASKVRFGPGLHTYYQLERATYQGALISRLLRNATIRSGFRVFRELGSRGSRGP